MIFFILLPFLLQVLIISFDEFYFHLKRGLPKWERLGHPFDTLTVLLCFAFVLFVPYSPLTLKIYIALSLFSCIFVTKDEFVHKKHCPPAELWLHALLFVNHPIVLTASGLLWNIVQQRQVPLWLGPLIPYAAHLQFMLLVQLIASGVFFLYQLIYWNFLWKEKTASTTASMKP